MAQLLTQEQIVSLLGKEKVPKFHYVLISGQGYRKYERGRVKFLVFSDKGVPVMLVRFYKDKSANIMIRTEFERQKLFFEMCEGVAIPRPVVLANINGLNVMAEEALSGTSLARFLIEEPTHENVSDGIGEAIQVQRALDRCLQPSSFLEFEKELDGVVSNFLEAYRPSLSERNEVKEYIAHLKQVFHDRVVYKRFSNGDFVPTNIVKQETGKNPGLLDFEFSEETHFYFLDWFRFFYYLFYFYGLSKDLVTEAIERHGVSDRYLRMALSNPERLSREERETAALWLLFFMKDFLVKSLVFSDPNLENERKALRLRIRRLSEPEIVVTARPLPERTIGDLEARVKGLEDQIQLKDSHIGDLEARVKAVEDSLAWKLVRRYRRLNDRWFPSGTGRRRVIDKLALALGIALEEGLRGLLRKAFDRYVKRRKQFFELGLDEQYQVWLKNNELTEEKLLESRREASQFSYQPMISIVMPVYNTEKKWLGIAIDSVINQVYPNWELCIVDDASTKKGIRKILGDYSAKDNRIKVKYLEENRGISGASNEALAMANGEFVGFLDHDDELTKDALFEVVRLLNRNPKLDLIYSDEDKKDLKGRRVEPFFKPDWSPDLLLSMNYVCHFSVVRKSLIEKIGGFRLGFEGSQDHDLILRVTELTDRIGHILKPLYSWRKVPGSAAALTEAKPYARESAKRALREALNRRGLNGEVLEGFGSYYRVRYALRGAPLVSIIIPTKDKVDLLKRCIESIESKTSYRNYEIIIVDNSSTDPATLTYLESIRHRVVKFDQPFNFSKINNFAARYAKGEHLLFLNNDIEVVEEHWLEAMLEHSQRPEVGMVGGLLLYPSGSAWHTPRTIQHAGVTLGVGGVAGHAFKYLPVDRHNYFNLHRVVRNCSAVTAACAMIRRNVFEEIGGFNENLRVAFGDIDLCLRLRKKGYLIIYTPYAMLYHHECATRGRLHPPEDEAYMIDLWGGTFIEGDPYYNPNLTLFREDYSLTLKGSSFRPLAVLLDIYYLRPDLQRAYPEARNGDYGRLIEWAATSGIRVDSMRGVMRPYSSYYASNTSRNVNRSLYGRPPKRVS